MLHEPLICVDKSKDAISSFEREIGILWLLRDHPNIVYVCTHYIIPSLTCPATWILSHAALHLNKPVFKRSFGTMGRSSANETTITEVYPENTIESSERHGVCDIDLSCAWYCACGCSGTLNEG